MVRVNGVRRTRGPGELRSGETIRLVPHNRARWDMAAINPPSDDRVENSLLGEWTCCSGTEIYRYSFKPGREFECAVSPLASSPYKVTGYWDVANGCLRMGTSATETADGKITCARDDHFAVEIPGGKTTTFQRQ